MLKKQIQTQNSNEKILKNSKTCRELHPEMQYFRPNNSNITILMKISKDQ